MKTSAVLTFFLLLFLSIWNIPGAIAQCKTSNDYLQNHYDSTQADFSNVFFDTTSVTAGRKKNFLKHFKKYDCAPLWINTAGQEGVLSIKYRRIQFKITSAEKDKNDPFIYHVAGKTKLHDTISSFTGTIRIFAAIPTSDDPAEIDSNKNGSLYSAYDFEQDNTLKNSGTFRGIACSGYTIDKKHKQFLSDTSNAGDDDFSDDTFVGIWCKYKTSVKVKCIWGIGRLPYCFDFDIGDGDMSPNPRYRMNGWETYPDDTWINAPQGTLPVKWWLPKE